MNKTGFIKELSDKIGYSIEDCEKINEVLENNFFLSKSNKEKIVSSLVDKLNINESDAINIYDTALSIIKGEVINKIKNPFKSKD